MLLLLTAGKLITLVLGKLNVCFSRRKFYLGRENSVSWHRELAYRPHVMSNLKTTHVKKNIGILFLVLLPTFSFGQIDNNLLNDNWKVGKEKIIYENSILRIQGKNDISGVTNIGFQTIEQKKAEIEKKAEDVLSPE